MAGVEEGSFQSWLSSRLRDLHADEEVFSPYILSILEEGANDSQDEVLDSLADVLEGLGLDDSLPENHADSPANIKSQIWSKWQQHKLSADGEAAEAAAISSESATTNIKSQLASITEKVTEEYKAKASQKPVNQSELDAKKAVKAAIMNQYQNGEVETDGESDGEDGGGAGGGGGGDETELGMMRNTNAEAVARAEQEKREKGRLAAAAKREKDKEDRDKQKKQAEDKKKKAQAKAAKVERRA